MIVYERIAIINTQNQSQRNIFQECIDRSCRLMTLPREQRRVISTEDSIGQVSVLETFS